MLGLFLWINYPLLPDREEYGWLSFCKLKM